jgi:hypothetical protein
MECPPTCPFDIQPELITSTITLRIVADQSIMLRRRSLLAFTAKVSIPH